MTNNESVFVKKLLELGFEQFDVREVSRRAGAYTVEPLDTLETPEPSKARSPMLGENEPCFICVEGGDAFSLTIAYDDCGQSWKKMKVVDLEPYGFTPALKPQLPN